MSSVYTWTTICRCFHIEIQEGLKLVTQKCIFTTKNNEVIILYTSYFLIKAFMLGITMQLDISARLTL